MISSSLATPPEWNVRIVSCVPGSLREAIFSPVAGSMISSANTRPTIRSSRDSIIPVPSLIASTSIPRMVLLRTLTSFASLFNTASIYSSVSGVFAGMISAPVLS